MHHRVGEGPVLTRRWAEQTAALVLFSFFPAILTLFVFPSPGFLGRTEVPVATIKKEMEIKGAANRRLLLHEVATGEVWVKLDLQLYCK